jgi:hypothetical protein
MNASNATRSVCLLNAVLFLVAAFGAQLTVVASQNRARTVEFRCRHQSQAEVVVAVKFSAMPATGVVGVQEVTDVWNARTAFPT